MFLCCLSNCHLLSGQHLTLRESIETGIQRNLSLQNKNLDLKQQTYTIKESRAQLLPIINAFGNFTNNVDRGTSVSDGTSRGIPYVETQGLRYSTNGGVQLSMPLYNQTIYTGISLSRKIEEISRLNYEQARQELVFQICKLYYLGQTTFRQIELTSENISRLEELNDITRAFYENEMTLEIDVKRVDINLENLKVQLSNAQSMYEQQLNLLKYTIGLPADTVFTLSPLDSDINLSFQWEGLSSNLPELRLLQEQIQMSKLQKRSVIQGYIPSLSLIGQLAYTNYTDHFRNYFHANTPESLNQWYNSFNWGLSLRIPIFDAFDKTLKYKKANVNHIKSKLALEDTRQRMETQYNNAMKEWMNNQRTYQRLDNNYKLAEEVYLVTAEKYKEGVSSMTELLQDELRMNEALNNYISSVYNYKMSELTLLRLSDRLTELQ